MTRKASLWNSRNLSLTIQSWRTTESCKTTIQGVSAADVLFVAAGNTLKNPSQVPSDMKGFRAYFLLKGLPAGARTFALNFGDEETGITFMEITDGTDAAAARYDLQGRRIEKAAQKGVYIQNGKKSVVK